MTETTAHWRLTIDLVDDRAVAPEGVLYPVTYTSATMLLSGPGVWRPDLMFAISGEFERQTKFKL